MTLHYGLKQNQEAPLSKEQLSVAVFVLCKTPLMRFGLEKLLAKTHFEVKDESFPELTNLPDLAKEEFVLFIIDGNGYSDATINLIGNLKAHRPDGKVVILADCFEPGDVRAAWNAGAQGFCLSSIGSEPLIRSLELVMLGETVLPSSLVLSAIEDSPACLTDRFAGRSNEYDVADLKGCKLSNREAEILLCMKEGDPNKIIARRLKLSEATVKVHVKAILKKIGAMNRTQAALWAAHNMSTFANRSKVALHDR